MAFAESRHDWVDQRQIVAALKSAITSSTTTDFGGCANVPIADSFAAFVRTASIPAQLALRPVPMLTRIFSESSGMVAAEVAEGGAIPVVRSTFASTSLTPRKFCGISVETDELVKSASPAATEALTAALARAVGAAESRAFLDWGTAGSATYGAVRLASSGSTASAMRTDLLSLVAAVPGAHLAGASWVMHPITASAMAATGDISFANLGPGGGVLWGLPVLTSDVCEQVGSPTSRFVVLMNPGECFYSGPIDTVDVSTETALQMLDAPTSNAANLVSAFETNSVVFRGIRRSNWFAGGGSCAVLSTSY